MSGSQENRGAQGEPCFKPVSSRVSFPELEGRILEFWQEREIFRRTWDEGGGTQDGAKPLFMLYEGPPTANGTPGIHHVLARVFKDVIPRYKTMKGYRALRKGGWDTHGLPVELEVEKELGISSKQEIEEYGIERFNARCRESVMRYVKEWEELTDRIAFWIDMKDAYITFTNDYIETGWWILKQLWDQGLVYQGMKGTPHCPRCVTSLSSHEVALGYQEETPDPSVFVKFRLNGEYEEGRPQGYDTLFPKGFDAAPPASFLAWTTTPWTLPGNTALAVKADADYLVAEVEGERLILAAALAEQVLVEGYQEVASLPGAALVGLTYEPLYDPIPAGAEVRQFQTVQQPGVGAVTRLETVESFASHVVAEEFVSLEDGTGIVHIAPAFGDEDLNVGRDRGLHFLQTVDLQGIVRGQYPGSGQFVKDADEAIMQDLEARGLLYRREVYRHTYPFCWRCNTPLLYYAKPSWYIRTTARQERLISANREINWYPEHIKEGRFGEWLRNNIDWAISRERYWGTPLPIWECSSCEAQLCTGSVAELRELAEPESRALLDSPDLDLHRPFIDRVTIRCEKCGGTMRRVPEVMDCWYDSGAMPYAQYHYPYENPSLLEDGRFPADYICEAVDQTRGWFYSLHALSVLLEGVPSYRNVLSLGLILDEAGEKMSKSKGNIVEPWAVINAHGADALRWNLFSAAPPGNDRRFSVDLVGESVRRFFLTLWNTYNFFVTYANIDGFRPSPDARPESPSDLDRWVLSELHSLVASVTESLEMYNPTDAARRIEEFTELLSTWYVRRSRRRFWKSEDDADKRSAYQTLYTCLAALSRLLAPFAPFLAEELYQNLVCSVDPGAPESVHLAAFPEADLSLIDHRLAQGMQLAMRIASLGRAARSKAKVRVRQPLSKMNVKIRSAEEFDLFPAALSYIMDELNVMELADGVTFSEDTASQWIQYQVKPNLELLGPKYGGEVGAIARELAAQDSAQVARQIKAGATVKVGGHDLQPEEVTIIESDMPGWVSASEGGYVVRISTEITPELAQEGLARELVHRIQNMRRSAGFDIADRIATYYQGPEAVREVMAARELGEYIRGETLSTRLVEGSPPEGAYAETQKVDDLEVTLAVQRV